MYYRFASADEQDLEDLPIYLCDVTPTEVAWGVGQLCAAPVPQPLKATVAPHSGTTLTDLLLSELPLFSSRLLAALGRAGVDNFECFAAEIYDPRDRLTHRDYRAVNLLGVVACADMVCSEWDLESAPPELRFERLVIDERRTLGLPMFRLGESLDTILVSEKVASAVQAAGLVGVQLTALPGGSPR